MLDEEPVQDNRERLCIHEIPRLATLSQNPLHAPVTQPPQPHQGVPVSWPQHQMEVHQQSEQTELDIPDDIPDLLEVPEEVIMQCNRNYNITYWKWLFNVT